MTNYEELLKHARGVQEAQSKQGLPAEEESKFLDCTQTMDILERREKGQVNEAFKTTLLTEALATGIFATSAALSTGNVGEALSVLGLGAMTAAATVGYKAFKDYLISKKYTKERQGLAAEYQAYLDSRQEPELSK